MPTSRAVAFGHLGSALRAYFEAVWDEALVPLGGAHAGHDSRFSFLHAQIMDEYPCTEYRFQGHFGFGGKLRTGHDLRCHVNYYPEDKTAAREQQQAAVNAKLAELWTQFLSTRLPDQA